MRMIFFHLINLRITTFHFVIVKVASIAWDTIIITHILRTSHFLTSHKGLIKLLSMTSTYYFDLRFTINWIDISIDFLQCSCKHFKCRSWSFLNKKVTIPPMFKSVDYQIYSIVQSHHKTGHIRISDSNRLTFHHLINP